MSFSSDVKAELARQCSKSRHCQLAELAGMLELEGAFSAESQADAKRRVLTLSSDNELLAEKFHTLIHKAFGFEAATGLGEAQSEEILRTLRWNPVADGKATLEEQRADGLLVQRTCCKRAFIRGAFMAAGSISDPNKSYHFEIVCHTVEQAEQLQKLIGSFDADAKIVERKERFVLYLKEGSQIVDMLNVMEAYVALMQLENVRILKEMRNSVNRKVNCETANINKTVNAAVKQMEDIKKVQQIIGFDNLPAQLAEIAQARLDHPDATLKELGTFLDPPVGKSGVNHRLHKLAEMAENL